MSDLYNTVKSFCCAKKRKASDQYALQPEIMRPMPKIVCKTRPPAQREFITLDTTGLQTRYSIFLLSRSTIVAEQIHKLGIHVYCTPCSNAMGTTSPDKVLIKDLKSGKITSEKIYREPTGKYIFLNTKSVQDSELHIFDEQGDILVNVCSIQFAEMLLIDARNFENYIHVIRNLVNNREFNPVSGVYAITQNYQAFYSTHEDYAKNLYRQLRNEDCWQGYLSFKPQFEHCCKNICLKVNDIMWPQNDFENTLQQGSIRTNDQRMTFSTQQNPEVSMNLTNGQGFSRLMNSGVGQNRLQDHSLKQLSPEKEKKKVVNPHHNVNGHNYHAKENGLQYSTNLNNSSFINNSRPNQAQGATAVSKENQFFGNYKDQSPYPQQQNSFTERNKPYEPSNKNQYVGTNDRDHTQIEINGSQTNQKRNGDLSHVLDDNTDRTQRKIINPFNSIKLNIERKLSFFGSKKPTGLKNFGNTCYMNSIIQCLTYCSDLSKYFEILFKNEFEPHKISHFLGQLVCTLRSESSKDPSYLEYLLRNLKGYLGQKNPDLDSSNQQDALEFFKTLLEQINNDESRIVSKPLYRQLSISLRGHKTVQTLSDEWHNHIKERENSIITDLFCGQLLNMIVCAQCRYEEISFEPYWDLSLAFHKKKVGLSPYNLHEMLRETFEADHVEYNLKECRCQGTLKTRISKIWRLPKILVIHFKRFKITQDGYDKIYAEVEFPEHLDLTPLAEDLKRLWFYNQDFGLGKLDKSLEHPKYNLFGVVNHVGNLDRGHYTAECKDPQTKAWYELNDDVVTKISGPGRWNECAYMLFYVKEEGEGF